MLVQIFKAGEEEHFNTFPLGNHVIGRGPALQCNDKRVSRNHAVIEVKKEAVNITSTHMNPCFLKVAGSTTITILKKDSTTQLNDGDTFALLPEDFWFKIKIFHDENLDVKETNSEATSGKTPKRAHSDEEDEEAEKKIKMEHTIGEDDVGSSVQNEVITMADTTTKQEEVQALSNETEEPSENAPEDVKGCNSTNDGTEAEASSNIQEDSASNSNQLDEDKTEASSSKDDSASNSNVDDPATSTSKSRRERCWYAATCYRKNPAHRSEFTHPGDSDFESDPDDNRPTCSYGAECYRKNKDHRRYFKHPQRQPKMKKKRDRKKVDRLNVASSEDMHEFSDSEDPFIDDDDSDEYTGQSDTDDSDWNESQEVDEDSQNVKRLVKEANKFIKS